MPNRIAVDFGGFSGRSSTEKLKELEKFKSIIDSDPDISDELQKLLKKKGIEVPDILKPPKIPFPGELGPFPLPFPPIIINPGPSLPPTAPTPPVFEIDTKLQLLLNAIPIADPGNIITSEYHNALRDAVRALASRIGLSVNPTAEFKILTFPPDFLPLPKKAETGGGPSGNNWEIALNRATLPSANLNIQNPVSGGFVVQLPDNASIIWMFVRGVRLGKDTQNPKAFNIKLNRLKLGKEDIAPTALINLDLQSVKGGLFEEKKGVELSGSEADVDIITAKSIIADRKMVNNETHLYFVTADWLGSDDKAARFEIHSIQIYCTV